MAFNEADTRAKLIDPAIYRRGWTEEMIRREETAGIIDVYEDGSAKRRSRGRIDYVLRVKVNMDTQPVALALLEAKKEKKPPNHGLEQAKSYASCRRLHVRFVFSSNGHLFVEYDSFTGQTSDPKPMSEFPTPEQLRERYEQGIGFALTSNEAKPLLQPYTGGEGARRYYQDAAIRAVMEKIAQCQNKNLPKRALLSLATGAGKTFIAVHLLKRLADAGQLRRALFLCDRDELRSQALKAFQNVFGSDAAEVFRKPDGTNNAKNARIHVATYQTLGVENDSAQANLLTAFYPEDFFTHIVIDECHRSAWGKWSQALTHNKNAAHIGLTATPRQLRSDVNHPEALQDQEITANNHRYFGEPVYEYELAQAIEDGYLAACKLQKSTVNLDDTGISKQDILARHPTDALTGKPITSTQLDELYSRYQYEDRILLPDRVWAMCQDLFQYLLQTGGPEQKTIIFCTRDRHADDVAAQMNNLYALWCKENGITTPCSTYAFKCTAASSGNDQLPDFRASSRGYFIATTVDLLTTGVDVPCVRNIVFFRYLHSPISFYQMVGRGTRIDIPTNKLMFHLYDYTNATRLFGQDFVTASPRSVRNNGSDAEASELLLREPTIHVRGFDVHITDAGRFVVAQVDGRAMPMSLEEYRERLAAQLTQQVPKLTDFRARWVEPIRRRELLDGLVLSGYSPEVIRMADDRQDCDLYDVLGEVGWGMNPRTRCDRSLAFIYKNEEWLASLPPQAAATIRAVAQQFEHGGTEALENPKIFQTPPIQRAGGLSALQSAGEPSVLLAEAKTRMFAA